MPIWIRSSLAAALIVAVATGCGGGDRDLPDPPASAPPSPGASPTSNLSPEDAEAAEDILAAFDNYMAAYIELTTAGVAGGIQETTDRFNEANIAGSAFLDLRDLLNDNYDAGYATTGTITWTAHVVEIDWEYVYEFRPDEIWPRATLEVCIDETVWSTVETGTGTVVDGPGGRFRSTVIAEWYDVDPQRPNLPAQWLVIDRQDSDEPC